MKHCPSSLLVWLPPVAWNTVSTALGNHLFASPALLDQVTGTTGPILLHPLWALVELASRSGL